MMRIGKNMFAAKEKKSRKSTYLQRKRGRKNKHRDEKSSLPYGTPDRNKTEHSGDSSSRTPSRERSSHRNYSPVQARVPPEKRVYPSAFDPPNRSQPLYDDDGDDPLINSNPLEINHPYEEPEDLLYPCKRLHQIPNFITDDPRNYINLKGMEGIGNANKGGILTTNTLLTSKNQNPDYSSQFTESRMIGSVETNNLDSDRKSRFIAQSDNGIIKEIKNEEERDKITPLR